MRVLLADKCKGSLSPNECVRSLIPCGKSREFSASWRSLTDGRGLFDRLEGADGEHRNSRLEVLEQKTIHLSLCRADVASQSRGVPS